MRFTVAAGSLVIVLLFGLSAASARPAARVEGRAEAPPTTPTTAAPAPSDIPLSADRPPALPSPAKPRSLPVTGVDVTETAVLGGAFVGAGALVLAARRRVAG